MFAKLPVSLSWFALTAFIYLLQWFPLTGVFLMMLAAPFWSVITVNAGFGLLALEALARPGLRIWLIAPVVYFGGYAIAAHLSHQELAKVDAEIRAFNAGKVATFSPTENDLVFEKKSRGLESAPSTLVSRYNLDVVYDANRNFDTAGHLARRIAKKGVCKSIRANKEARAAFIHAYGFLKKSKLSKTLCSFSGPEDPVRPVVSVSSRRTSDENWLLPSKIDSITIREPGGRTTELKSGSAAPLQWFPMPVMGCALNSGAPSWDCFHGFFRMGRQGLGATGSYGAANIPIIVKALGLRRVTDAELESKATDRLPDALHAIIAKRIVISLANLKRIIANPAERLTIHDIKGMKARPDLWRDDIPAMTQTLVRAFDGGHATRERAGLLQDLLNTLPQAEYHTVGLKILSALTARPELKRNFIRSKTLARLGELGPVALPLLKEKLFMGRRGMNTGAVFGLCRIGPPAASLANAMSETALDPKRRSSRDTKFAVYVTLLRFGQPDLAESVRTGSRLAKNRVAAKLGALVTPASTPDVCVDRNTWQKRLRKSGS